MNRRRVPFIILMFVVLSLLSGCARKNEKKPLPQNEEPVYSTLQAAAEADRYENGCVSCHKKTADVDRSLPAYVKRIGGHPEVRDATVNACYECHEAEKNYNLYKRFYQGIHRSHWRSSTFYSKQKAQCYSCHTVEANGVSGIKNYPLAGYRTGITGKTTGQPKTKGAPEKAVQPQRKPLPEETRQPKPEEQRQQEKELPREEAVPAPSP